jgi:hypothetical protein
MRELLIRGKNTIDPEVIDPGGRSVEDSPVKVTLLLPFTCYSETPDLIPLVKSHFKAT